MGCAAVLFGIGHFRKVRRSRDVVIYRWEVNGVVRQSTESFFYFDPLSDESSGGGGEVYRTTHRTVRSIRVRSQVPGASRFPL